MNFDKYKNKCKYPYVQDYEIYKVVTIDNTYTNLTYDSFRKLTKDLDSANIKYLFTKEIVDVAQYDKDLVAYITEEQRIEQEFIGDLKSTYGTFDLFNNAEKLFTLTYNKACERRHADGYSAICEEYSELYDFAYDILECVKEK